MLAALLGVLLCAVFVIVVRTRTKRSLHKLPPVYPGQLPIIGHAYKLLSDTSTLWLRLKDIAKYSVAHGGVACGKMGSEVYYFITDAQDALTASNICTRRYYGIEFSKSWLGDGLMTSHGEVWRYHRKHLYPAFTLTTIYTYIDAFNSQTRQFCHDLEFHIGKGPFDHYHYLTKTMLQTLSQPLFGMETIEDENIIKYTETMPALINLHLTRFRHFWLLNDSLYRLSSLKKKENDLVTIIDTITNKTIKSKKLAIQNGALHEDSNTKGSKCKPLLQLLLELSSEAGFTDQDIRDEIHTMVLGGFDTTSTLLTYILLMLGAHPEVQHKMLTEFLEVVGPDGDVMNEHLNRLVYTNAVITETLRLHPIASILPRSVEKDVKLKNYTMRAGSQCFIIPLVSEHDPIWGPDGDIFRPERWLETENLIDPKEFAGFGLGKRACIGKQLAMIIMKVLLAHVVRQYKITADKSNLQLKMDFVLRPAVGYWISIEKRI